MTITAFGREKEQWEYVVDALCARGGILTDSRQWRALYALSDDEFAKLTSAKR